MIVEVKIDWQDVRRKSEFIDIEFPKCHSVHNINVLYDSEKKQILNALINIKNLTKYHMGVIDLRYYLHALETLIQRSVPAELIMVYADIRIWIMYYPNPSKSFIREIEHKMSFTYSCKETTLDQWIEDYLNVPKQFKV